VTQIPRLTLLAFVLLVATAGCSATVTGGPTSSTSSRQPSSAAASAGAVKSPPASPRHTKTPAPTAHASTGEVASEEPEATISTTRTPWGVILDALPSSFPRYPGAKPTDLREGPASAAFLVPADAVVVTDWYQSALEIAQYTTVALSGPLEDGSYQIDSMGAAPACKARTMLRPQHGSTIVVVLLGAACG